MLIDVEWTETFFNIKVWGLPRSISDHCPLLLEEEDLNWGPKPFHNLDAWFSHDGFIELVKQEWRKLEGLDVTERLKGLKVPIRKIKKHLVLLM